MHKSLLKKHLKIMQAVKNHHEHYQACTIYLNKDFSYFSICVPQNPKFHENVVKFCVREEKLNLNAANLLSLELYLFFIVSEYFFFSTLSLRHPALKYVLS